MESIVNITVVQPVNHYTTVAEPQGSVWTDVSQDGKDFIVITVRIFNILFSHLNKK